jgi:ADP-ribosylglycohydrolase
MTDRTAASALNVDPVDDATTTDRALGALTGLALGDALGMPTQSMSPAEIAEDYGTITGFRHAGPRQRIAAGMVAGSITDDTEQAVMLAELLIEGAGVVDARLFAERLLDWERGMRAKGSLDLLGPSTKAAVERILQGASLDESGRFGATNGAAMRITPVGITADVANLDSFVDAVVDASAVTHNTTLGIASAAAVGAAVSAGINGADVPTAIRHAIAAARVGETRGHWVAGGSIADRTEVAIDLLRGATPGDRVQLLRTVIGTSVASQESVVAALALVAVADGEADATPWSTLCQAAGLGGDTDTIAAMAGAILGAVHGMSAWPDAEVAVLNTVNELHLDDLAHDLLRLRHRR